MKLFELRLPGGRTILAAGIVTDGIRRMLGLWIGTRQCLIDLNRAPAFRPGGMARW